MLCMLLMLLMLWFKQHLCYKNNINNKHNFRRLYDCFCLSKSISMHPYFQLMPD